MKWAYSIRAKQHDGTICKCDRNKKRNVTEQHPKLLEVTLSRLSCIVTHVLKHEN